MCTPSNVAQLNTTGASVSGAIYVSLNGEIEENCDCRRGRYTLTGNATYLTAMQGAWEMFRESFLHVGGAMALNEGSHGTDLNSV